jgi:DNA-binding beta-propeller fold protein YncE
VADDDEVTVIDGATNVTESVALGGKASHIAVDSVTNKFYVSVGQAPTGNVTVVDGETNQVLTTFPLGEFTASSIAVNTVTNEAYALVSFYHASGAMIIDGASLQISGELSTDELGGPSDTIGLNTKTNKVYLVYPEVLYEFDGVTKKANVMLPTSPVATRVLVDDVINQVYVLIGSQPSDPSVPGSVFAVDGTSDATNSLQVGFNPSAMALNSATGRVYVTNLSCIVPDCTPAVAGTVSVIEAAH